MPDHCERWMLRDPAEIIDRLLAQSSTRERRAAVPHETVQPSAQVRDPYYTQARRLVIRNLMRGR